MITSSYTLYLATLYTLFTLYYSSLLLLLFLLPLLHFRAVIYFFRFLNSSRRAISQVSFSLRERSLMSFKKL